MVKLFAFASALFAVGALPVDADSVSSSAAAPSLAPPANAVPVAPPSVVPVAPHPTLLARGGPVRIMALGDSITAGVGKAADPGGYRGTLARLLARAGYRAEFVGSRSDFSSDLAQPAHEGWPGYVLRSFASDPGPGELYGALARRAIATYHPDVILLMAGTNDLLRLEEGRAGYTLPNVEHSMYLLVEEILTEAPHVHLVIAPVVASPKIAARTLARFAGTGLGGARPDPESVAALVATFAARGYAVTDAAEMARAVPRDVAHFPDRLHPSGMGGYDDIARVWSRALDAISERPAAVTKPIARVPLPAAETGPVARETVAPPSGQ